MRSKYDIIVRPLFSEKNTYLNEKENKVVLKVAKWANKIEIKRAVEEIFNVHVIKVNTNSL